MSMRIDNRFKYFKDINESLKRKYQTTEDFSYSEMAPAIDNIPSGGTLISKTITENGVYNASSDNADGYDVVTVEVPERNTFDEYFADTLEIANIPSATTIITGMFLNRTTLKSINMPNVIHLYNGCFLNCNNLVITELPTGVTEIQTNAFRSCTSIPYLDFSNFDHIPTLGSHGFRDTTFPFYFRDQQQLDEWAAATNWSTYANRFQIKPSEVI